MWYMHLRSSVGHLHAISARANNRKAMPSRFWGSAGSLSRTSTKISSWVFKIYSPKRVGKVRPMGNLTSIGPSCRIVSRVDRKEGSLSVAA
jgi:hypothetical protein